MPFKGWSREAAKDDDETKRIFLSAPIPRARGLAQIFLCLKNAQ
jgi:hypothetical protein